MDNTSIKLVISAAAAALMTYLSEMVIPVMILCFVMFLDYCTGVHAAYVQHTLSSRVGILGILKKLSYLAMVAAACVIDWLLITVGAKLGAVITVQFVGLLVTFWLIVNELISVLENIDKAGGPVPPFVEKLLWRLKGTVEEALPDLPDEEPKADEYVGRHERRDEGGDAND